MKCRLRLRLPTPVPRQVTATPDDHVLSDLTAAAIPQGTPTPHLSIRLICRVAFPASEGRSQAVNACGERDPMREDDADRYNRTLRVRVRHRCLERAAVQSRRWT